MVSESISNVILLRSHQRYTKSLQEKAKRPEIIFGSSDERSYGEYTVAWAILYRRFKKDGINKDSAKQALKEIHAVVSDKFLYRRWNTAQGEYVFYPRKGETYEITKLRWLENRRFSSAEAGCFAGYDRVSRCSDDALIAMRTGLPRCSPGPLLPAILPSRALGDSACQ